MDVEKTDEKLTKQQQGIILALILAGVLLRFLFLDSRPLHHDESLHGMYGKYIIDNADLQFYHYDPMLHGPLLYNVVASLFALFGTTTFVLRSLNAGLGSILLFSPLLFRRYLSPWAVVAATAALAFSPSFTYWARFAHHDDLVLFSYLLLAIAVFLVPRRGGIILGCISFSLQYTIKANIFVFAALLLGYLLFEWAVCNYKREESALRRLTALLSQNRWELFVGLTAGIAIFVALYSANFRYREGILDGLYRKVFPYWIAQHAQQRLEGPFSYHLFVMSLYELPLLAAFVLSLWTTVKRFNRLGILILCGVVFIGAVAGIAIPEGVYKEGFAKDHLKLRSGFDLWLCVSTAYLAVVLPLFHRLRGERALAFSSYFALATFWTYSFLGEKVPWLTIYPQLGFLVYSILCIDRFWQKVLGRELNFGKFLAIFFNAMMICGVLAIIEALLLGDDNALTRPAILAIGWGFGLALVFTIVSVLKILPDFRIGTLAGVALGLLTLYTAVVTNFTRAGDKRELFSQVHTDQEMHDLLFNVRSKLSDRTGGYAPKIFVTGPAVWPATWYLRDLKGYKFQAAENEYNTFDFILAGEDEQKLPPEFKVELVPLQSWWVPDYSKLRLRSILEYYLTHEPWSQTGSLNVKYAYPESLNLQEDTGEVVPDEDEGSEDFSEEENSSHMESK